MKDFSELSLLSEEDFKKELSELESFDLVNYLKSCSDAKEKDEYYKLIKLFFGKKYLKEIKTKINYSNKNNLKSGNEHANKNGIIIISIYCIC